MKRWENILVDRLVKGAQKRVEKEEPKYINLFNSGVVINLRQLKLGLLKLVSDNNKPYDGKGR